MVHQFQDLEDKENALRKSIGLPPISWEDLYRQEREFIMSRPRQRKSTRIAAKESAASVESASPLLNSALQGIEKKMKEEDRRKSEDRIRVRRDLEKTEALGNSLESLSRSTAESIDLLEELLRLVKSGEFTGGSQRRERTFQDASALGFIVGTGVSAAGIAASRLMGGGRQGTETAAPVMASPDATDPASLGLIPDQAPTQQETAPATRASVAGYEQRTSNDLISRTSGATSVGSDSVIPKAPVSTATGAKVPMTLPDLKTPVTGGSLVSSGPRFSDMSEAAAGAPMRELAIKARKITFSGDEIRLGRVRQDPGVGVTTAPGQMKEPSGMGPPKDGPTVAGTSPAIVETAPGGGVGSASDLKFAPGVDSRIKETIASKVKNIESDVGKPFLVTSGFRDPQRNAAVGGAGNSAHTRANAVDIRFSGTVEDTVKLIEEASAEGIGGIGVYGPGRVHLDTESKRVWGPDFTSRSIPEWAKPALDAHMGARKAEPVTSPTMESGPMAESTPGPEMVASDTGMAQAVTAASQENAIEERIPVPVTEIVSDAGVSVPNSSVGAPTYAHSPDEPGNVEPEDAAERYAKLFNMAA